MIRTVLPALLLLTTLCNAQSSFQKLYITVNGSQTSSIKHTADGGFVSSGGGSAAYWVMKADASGNIQWAKNLSNAFRILSIRQTNDGGYAGCGTGSNGAGKNLALLVKMDPSGNIQWSKLYGDTASSSAADLEQTSDGGYIMTGVIGSVLTAQDVYVIKTDSLGNQQWANRYASSTPVADVTSSVIQSNGAYYVSGNTQYSLSSIDALLIKIKSNGNLAWSYTFDVNGNRGFANEVLAAQNGNLVMVGFDEEVSQNPDATLARLDTSGNILWAKKYSTNGPDYGFSLYENQDQSIVFTGASDSTSGVNSSRDVMLIKTDQNGNMLWSRQFGGAGFDQPLHNCLDKTSDGGYIVQATTINSFSSNLAYSTYVIKTNANGNVICNEVPNSFNVSSATFIRNSFALTRTSEGSAQNVSITPVAFASDTTLCFSTGIESHDLNSETLSLYPNPAGNLIYITARTIIRSAMIYSMDGKQISEEIVLNSTTGSLNTELLPAGSYLLRAITTEGVISHLFTKE